MGIDIEGGMIVGAAAKEFVARHDGDDDWSLGEWADDHDMACMSPWYDADYEDQYIGFSVSDMPISGITDAWVADIREKAARFKELTGLEASLIGMQNVW